MRLCSVEGCGKKHWGRGFCSGHYSAYKREVDPAYKEKQRQSSLASSRKYKEKYRLGYRERYAKDPLRYESSTRNARLRNTFGITLQQYEELLKSQNNVCAVCFKPCSTGRRLAVDHCHKTGKVRGLLCNNCNSGLGKLGDCLEGLEAARNYLLKRS